MGEFLNSRWWVGDLTLFEALAGGAFDHLNCQHTRELDQNFSKTSKAWGSTPGRGKAWTVLELTDKLNSCFILKLVTKRPDVLH